MRLPVAPEHRVAGIAERLARLLREPDLTAKLRAIAVTEYDWAIRADAMVKAYARLTRRPAAG